MSLKKTTISGLIFIFAALAGKVIYGSLNQNQPSQKQTQDNKILITTSFYPLYFLTKEITGDKAEVINLTKTGGEPHDYEPSTKDIMTIENSQLLIVNGAFFESWLSKFDKEINSDNKQILKVAENIADLKFEEGGTLETDAHVWLDPVLTQKEVELINEKLKVIDPKNAKSYQENTEKLLQKLVELDNEFKLGLTNCENDKVITSHAAFAYLAKRYGFQQIAIQGLNPDEDPSPAKIAATTKLAKENNVRYIFFETLVSPKISETIAKEIGAKTLIFNPIEGLSDEEEQSDKNYFSIQRENLASLRLALSCQ